MSNHVELLGPIAHLVDQSLAHMHGEKRNTFTARCMQILSDCVARLSHEAKRCSNSDWIRLKELWSSVRQEYEANARLQSLENLAATPGGWQLEAAENLRQDIMWLAEQGNPGNVPLLERIKKLNHLSEEDRNLVEQAIKRLQERQTPEDVQQAVNFYLLTQLGDALYAEPDRAVRHETGIFVPIYHKAGHFRGILDVGGNSLSGWVIDWYDAGQAEPFPDGLGIAILDRQTKQRRGLLHFRPDGQRLAWHPATETRMTT